MSSISIGSVDVGNRNGNATGENRDSAPLALVVIDPHPLTRIALEHLLQSPSPKNRRADDFTVRSFASVDDALKNQCVDPNLIVLNVHGVCPTNANIINTISQLVTSYAKTPLVMVAECENPHHIAGVFKLGVRGILSSKANPCTLIRVLQLVQADGLYVPDTVLVGLNGNGSNGECCGAECEKAVGTHSFAIEDNIPAQFTPRQVEVFHRLRKGKSNKIIAYELGMRESTVKVHVRDIMNKLSARNRTHAVFLASERRSVVTQDGALAPLFEAQRFDRVEP